MFVSVVIVAAGKGSRMNMNINKQYIELLGKPVLTKTLTAFQNCSSVSEIILVVSEHEAEYCKKNIINPNRFDKVKCLVAGGIKRQESVYNGLLQVSKQCDIVLIHDGARPFINERCINGSIDAANEYGASCIAVPVKDTIKTSDSGFIDKTIDRSILWSIQTPQAFRSDVILKAHLNAKEENFDGTDDAVLVERMGIKVKLVMGDYNNIKITTREDIVIGEAIARSMDNSES